MIYAPVMPKVVLPKSSLGDHFWQQKGFPWGMVIIFGSNKWSPSAKTGPSLEIWRCAKWLKLLCAPTEELFFLEPVRVLETIESHEM